MKNNLSKILAENNTNATKLANEIGVSRNTINSFKNQKAENFRMNTLISIADYFQISIDYLMGYERKGFKKYCEKCGQKIY